MVANTSISQHRILGSSNEMVQTIEHLYTLVRLDNAIRKTLKKTPAARNEVLEVAVNTLKKAAEQIRNQSLDVIKQTVSNGFDGIVFLQKYYFPILSRIKSKKEFSDVVQKLIMDVRSVIESPMVLPQRGTQGPTFLTNYIEYPSAHIQAFVIKSTESWEPLCSRLYEIFSRCAVNKGLARVCHHGFAVPHSGGINFNSAHYQDVDGRVVQINDQAEKLKKIFTELAEAYSSKKLSDQIMLSERIDGANLFDFAHTQYEFLDKNERSKLFNSLGALAVVDVIAGLLDRLIQIEYLNKDYKLSTLETNLGNAMVKVVHHKVVLFAIDNGLDKEMMEPENRAKYLLFLTRLFLDGNVSLKLAENLKNNILHAIDYQVDDENENVVFFRNGFAAFKEDVIKLGSIKFCNGIDLMVSHLRRELPKKISEFDELFSGLPLENKKCRQLIEAVRERLKLFQLFFIHFNADEIDKLFPELYAKFPNLIRDVRENLKLIQKNEGKV